MKEIEQHILSYHDLAPEEQDGVEQYVEAHPEWTPLLDDVKALEALASEARLLRGAGVHDALLAYYVVSEYGGFHGVSEWMQERFDQIRAQLDSDAELRARYEAFRQRLDDALAGSDPIDQFERLSGHSLDAFPSSEESSPTDEALPQTEPQSPWLGWVTAMPRAFQWALAAVCIIAIGYGGLYLASEWSQSELEELAALQPSEMQVEGYTLRLRGAETSAAADPDVTYRQALATLRDARQSPLGLFPHYNTEGLARAGTLLTQVIDQEEAGSFLQLEAHYFLGKVRLAQEDTEQARFHFKTVVEGEGSKARESAIILKELQRIAPSQKGAESYFGPDHRLPTGSDAPDA